MDGRLQSHTHTDRLTVTQSLSHSISSLLFLFIFWLVVVYLGRHLLLSFAALPFTFFFLSRKKKQQPEWMGTAKSPPRDFDRSGAIKSVWGWNISIPTAFFFLPGRLHTSQCLSEKREKNMRVISYHFLSARVVFPSFFLFFAFHDSTQHKL